MADDCTEISLAGETEWQEFVASNKEALLETLGSINVARHAAMGNGFKIGGGAAPLYRVRLMAPGIEAAP